MIKGHRSAFPLVACSWTAAFDGQERMGEKGEQVEKWACSNKARQFKFNNEFGAKQVSAFVAWTFTKNSCCLFETLGHLQNVSEEMESFNFFFQFTPSHSGRYRKLRARRWRMYFVWKVNVYLAILTKCYSNIPTLHEWTCWQATQDVKGDICRTSMQKFALSCLGSTITRTQVSRRARIYESL